MGADFLCGGGRGGALGVATGGAPPMGADFFCGGGRGGAPGAATGGAPARGAERFCGGGRGGALRTTEAGGVKTGADFFWGGGAFDAGVGAGAAPAVKSVPVLGRGGGKGGARKPVLAWVGGTGGAAEVGRAPVLGREGGKGEGGRGPVRGRGKREEASSAGRFSRREPVVRLRAGDGVVAGGRVGGVTASFAGADSGGRINESDDLERNGAGSGGGAGLAATTGDRGGGGTPGNDCVAGRAGGLAW
jgi:hypothetical protein